MARLNKNNTTKNKKAQKAFMTKTANENAARGGKGPDLRTIGGRKMTAGRKAAATRGRNAAVKAAGTVRAGKIAGGGYLGKRKAAAARKGLARKGGPEFQGPMPKGIGARGTAIYRGAGVSASRRKSRD